MFEGIGILISDLGEEDELEVLEVNTGAVLETIVAAIITLLCLFLIQNNN